MRRTILSARGCCPGRIHSLVLVFVAVMCPMPTRPLARNSVMANPRPIKDASSISSPSQRIIIRSTTAADLPIIADILATASLQLTHSQASNHRRRIGFMAKMDHLWARNDIEQLISVRQKALQEARKQLRPFRSPKSTDGSTDRLSVLWKSDAFRKLIYRAATETGEPNVWRSHNYQLPPASKTWLQHLQMTACEADGGRVVAFCEIAMLSNPSAMSIQRPMDGAELNVPNHTPATCTVYSPAILNLCVDTPYRRRGLAKRMMYRAERFVQRYWKADTLGLYVHANNDAARALYRRMGYQALKDTDHGAEEHGARKGTDATIYMQKDLRSYKTC